MMCLSVPYCTKVYPIRLYLYLYLYLCVCLHLCYAALYFILSRSSEAVFSPIARWWMRHFHIPLFIRIDQTSQVSTVQTSRCWIWQPHLQFQHLYYIVPHITKGVVGDIPFSSHFTTLKTLRWLRCVTMLHSLLHHVVLSYWDAVLLYVYPYLYLCLCYAVSLSQQWRRYSHLLQDVG